VLNREQINHLYQYGLSLTVDKSRAEDLLQTAIEQLLTLSQPPRSIMAYARTIMRNRFIDDSRHQNLIYFESIEQDAPVLLDESDLEGLIIDRDSIDKLISQLNNAEREILFLWAVEGYTAAEIAEQISAPRGTVLARLHRIKKKLQKQAEQADIVEASHE
jgi:RNA polymerase sigma-70 factor (ECF subfamily)